MLKVYTDAATKGNPGPSGAGIVLVGENRYEQLSFPLTILSNHEAEFEAVRLALQFLIEKELNNQTVLLYTDSKVVAQTVEKDYTSNPKFLDYLSDLRQIFPLFPLIVIQWIPEKENKGADNLARQGLQKALKLYK